MDILFWSGGKDAFLAYECYQQEHPDREIQLLTTYEESTDIVPHQNIALTHIRKQAAYLQLELMAVPLPPECPNGIYLKEVEQALSQHSNIQHLIFGDWHLEDIRAWREKVFAEMGYDCLFPIWQKSIHELLPILQFKPIDIVINAVQEEYQSLLKVGEPFNQALAIQLHRLSDIDPMGEHGEFHTKVNFKNLDTEIS
jgi:diphthamide synthase (EF-2-diphthine--ammonia ligase)